jgi:hypothetical protein
MPSVLRPQPALPQLRIPRLAEFGMPALDAPDLSDARVFLLFLMPTLAEAAGVSIKSAPDDVGGWLGSLAPVQIGLLEKLNRADAKHLAKQSVLVMPDVFEDAEDTAVEATVAPPVDELDYSPMARRWPAAGDLAKAIYVDLTIQAFAAYEHGVLVHWGPISSGGAASPTPTGTYHLNWRARTHASTVNNEWRLPWYFNLDNRAGIAFHQYDLPGAAASHGCIRLLERDARWLYTWGETWALSTDGRDVTAPGTPVIIQGAYGHRETPPWRQQKNWLKPVEPPALPQALRSAA